jgi:hypothetical protein
MGDTFRGYALKPFAALNHLSRSSSVCQDCAACGVHLYMTNRTKRLT